MKHLQTLRANSGLLRVCAFADGLPLSGKGAFAKYLCGPYGWHHDSMGDHCRDERKRGNVLYGGAATGDMVPNEPIIDYGTRQLIQATINGRNQYYPDGWRRNTEQNPHFLAVAKNNGFLTICIQFTTPAHVCIARVEQAAQERSDRPDGSVDKMIKRILEWDPMNTLVFEQTRRLRDASQVHLIEVDNTNMMPEETAHYVLTQLDGIVGTHIGMPRARQRQPGFVPAAALTDG